MNPIHLEPNTVKDLAAVISPKYQHTKLAQSAAEFLVEQMAPGTLAGNRPIAPSHPSFDAATVRAFVEFLITNKGYN